MNPALPIEHFVPDPEAHQWRDGRIYIYGSYDISGNTSYCSYEYRVFSSEDLTNWIDHGISFKSTGENSDVPWSKSSLFAPDCIFHNGTYYMYFCMQDNSEGVATSKLPYGPFKNAAPVKGAHGDAIDPAAFVDDDGTAYLYWGQFHCRSARLKPNMMEIEEETLNTNLVNESEHGFHEGASMRKHKGIYYLIYTDISRGKATCISYATSRSPLGPFVKGGVIIDNIGCDPGTWNNHGSIAEFNGNWYVFYHRSSKGTKFNRRMCIEPIHFNLDGSINEVEMTTQGVSAPVKACSLIGSNRACLLGGKVHTEAVYPGQGSNKYSEHLSNIHNGDWAAYKYIDFEDGYSSFEVHASSLTSGGSIDIKTDSPEGSIIGVCQVPGTGGWHKWERISCSVKSIQGIHSLYLVFKGRPGRLFNISSFSFKK